MMATDVGQARVRRRAEGDRWPLVGRSREIALLREAIARAPRRGHHRAGRRRQDRAGRRRGRVRPRAGHGGRRGGRDGVGPGLRLRRVRLAPPPGLTPGPSGPESHAELLRQYTRELLDEACGRPLLVFVDDAHLLDDGSAMLVHQLVPDRVGHGPDLRAGLTDGRSGPLPMPMVVLWKDHSARRIELGPLGEHGGRGAAAGRPGRPGRHRDRASDRRAHAGRPPLPRELVDGALESGAVGRRRWGLAPARPAAAHARGWSSWSPCGWAPVTEAERHVLELIALGRAAGPVDPRPAGRSGRGGVPRGQGSDRQPQGRPASPGRTWPTRSSATSCASASARAASVRWPGRWPRRRAAAARRTRCTWPRCAWSAAGAAPNCWWPAPRRRGTSATSS